MGGQAKGKKSSKSKKTHREGSRAHSLCGVPAKERMKINLQNKAKKKTEEKYSIAQLLEKVDEYMDNFNYEMAQLFCQRALDIEPTSLEILDLMGNICMEMGDAEKAKQVFLKSVELSPDKGHAKYMYLGQIHCKEEALQYFRKGLEVLIGAYQSQPHALGAASCPEKMEVTARDISTAFCSVAEIYLTDLCMEEGAGDKCKEAIQKALEYDPNSTESLQLMASYYFSMEQIQEGKEYLMKSVAQWLPNLQKKAEGSLSQNIVTTDVLETVLPPYESRITTAKLLTEAEEFELASDILEGLLEEDDEVIQVWYLLGWVCYLQGKTPDEEDAFKDSARMYLMKAKKLYNKLKCDDSQLLEHVEQLLSELGGGDGQLGDSDAEDELPENIEDDFVQSSEDDEEAMES